VLRCRNCPTHANMNRNKADVARELRMIADLQEIAGASPFKVRALRQAALTVAEAPLPPGELLHSVTPGIGSSTLRLIHGLLDKGLDATLASLQLPIPLTLWELTQVPGIGPKTAHELYRHLNICCLADLEQALANGRLSSVPGFGPRRLQRLKRDIPVLRHRRETLPIAIAWPLSARLLSLVEKLPGVQRAAVTGAARRLVVTVPRLDFVVAMEDDAAFMEWVTAFHPNFGEGYIDLDADSVAAWTHAGRSVPVRFYLSSPGQFPARLMETTGDDTHQAVMATLADEMGYAWTPEGLRESDGGWLPFASEGAIYDAFGLPHYPPEVREGRGLLCNPENFIQRADIRGDLHVHSTWSDGSQSIAEIVQMAERMGYEYIAITDHSQSLAIAGGLSVEQLHRQREEMERLRGQTNVVLLHGMEVDILADGTLDMPDEELWDLDIVVASIHSAMGQSKEKITERLVRAAQHPAVDIIGHMTGRIIGRRSAYELDFDQVLPAAVSRGIALELNANPNRLDLSDEYLRAASAAGVPIAVDTDAHHLSEFENMDYGIRMAHRGWLQKGDVLNALPFGKLRERLHKYRREAGGTEV
jgi:DNA polymerase (family X)